MIASKRQLLVALLLMAGCQRSLTPTPNLYVDAESDPFADVPEVFRTNKIDLLYVTDREAEGEHYNRVLYGYRRSPWVAWGSLVVEIGDDVSWPDLVEASRSEKRKVALPLRLGAVTELGRFPETPPPLEIEGDRVEETAAYIAERSVAYAHLHEELRRRLALSPRKGVLVYIHGYKNTIQDAAFRLAELWHFLGREGVPILYSWPAGSPGVILGYNRDRESSELTVFHFKQLLTALSRCDEVEQVNIIAHSRGTDVVMTALRELVLVSRGAGRDPNALYKIGHLVLAAPDLDLGVAAQRQASDRTFRIYDDLTIYVTAHDKALGSAEWLFRTKGRMGKMRPEEMNEHLRNRLASTRKMNVIDARVRTDFVGHEYFMSDPAASSDVILLLRYDLPPGTEHGRPLTELVPRWYILDDNYPREAAPLPKAMRKE